MIEFSFEELQRRRIANIQSQFVNAEELQKGEQDELEKASHGFYEDNAENRRLNRVGKEYGSKGSGKSKTPEQRKDEFIKKHAAIVEKWKEEGNIAGLKKEIASVKMEYAANRTMREKLVAELEDAIAIAKEKRSSRQRTKKNEETSGNGGKTVADHAANTDSKVLKKVVDDPDAKPELKEAAQAELKKRGEGESRQPLRRKMFSKEDVKVKAAESLRSAFEKLSEEYEKVYFEDGSIDEDAALAADDKFLKEVHKLIVNGELGKKTFFEVRESNPNWKYGFDGMPSYEEIRDNEEYMSDEEKNSPDFGAKRFETFINKYLMGYDDDVYTDDGFDEDAALKLDKEFNESVYKLIKDGKLDKKTFEETKKKFKSIEYYDIVLPTYEEYKKHNF